MATRNRHCLKPLLEETPAQTVFIPFISASGACILNVVAALHTILLGTFLSVTSLLVLITLANRMRVRRVRMVWRPGGRWSFPVWPTGFVGIVLLLWSFSLSIGPSLHPSIFTGYLMGGVFWWVAVWLSQNVLVTEEGILRYVGRHHEALAWGQVCDYFERSGQNLVRFSFLYTDASGTRRRFDLPVPAGCQARFRQLLREKLDARMAFMTEQLYGKEALEG